MGDFDIIKHKLQTELKNYEFRIGFTPQSAVSAAMLVWSENDNFNWCTEESRIQCLIDMLVFGLNPLKKQCYFIPFKDKKKGPVLTFVMDYAGAIVAAKDTNKTIKDIRAQLVREGDDFKFSIENGIYVVKRHEPTAKSLSGKPIMAYCIAVDKDDRPIAMDIINYDQYVEHVRRHSKHINGQPTVNADGTFHPYSNHAKYPEKMFLKTVIHRLCKTIIKTSPNEKVLTASSRSFEDDFADDDYIVSEPNQTVEPEIKTLDFAPRPKSQPESQPESEPMANREQAEKIVAHHKNAGTDDKMMIDISEFVGRQVEKIRYITQIEAAQYLAKIETKDQTPPDDEPPPWK